ncbi:MAG: molybdopterin molybdotransferase MoeA [Phaeodactylibacter sp.]|nr:molybdopterin molybdotransferase MoeA [Phaeodactylibacter sp.]MCB9275147.1 molybdopterin molybdotransferase MoeA [Lewinellaceae bacterium]
MITVEQAVAIIEQTIKDFGVEEVPLDEAIGRVLRENLYADRDFPPFHRVTMDGIALRFDAFQSGQRTFSIEGIAAAGAAQQALHSPGSCLEVMTGAMLPEGTDTVIRYEDLHISNSQAEVKLGEAKWGLNVHKKGEDRKEGSLIIQAGLKISPAEIGVAATVGKAMLKVSRLPKTVVISTGDELVEVGKAPLPHQIRRSNEHQLKAALAKHKLRVEARHLRDELDEVVAGLEAMLAEYEVLILSGGVSEGKFDYLPQALEQLGVVKLFHKIKQRPGKPFWFGQAPNGALVFALPGNPVSSFMCTQRYIVPWLEQSLGLPAPAYPRAVLARDTTFKPDLTYFLQVRTEYDARGQLLAHPAEGHGSGDLANLVDADGFLQLPMGKDVFKKGEAFPLIVYR